MSLVLAYYGITKSVFYLLSDQTTLIVVQYKNAVHSEIDLICHTSFIQHFQQYPAIFFYFTRFIGFSHEGQVLYCFKNHCYIGKNVKFLVMVIGHVVVKASFELVINLGYII